MGVPRCHRCGIYSYGGEVTIDTKSVGDEMMRSSKTYSLCGYCLPIVVAKLHGFMNDHHMDPPASNPNSHNVFRDAKVENG